MPGTEYRKPEFMPQEITSLMNSASVSLRSSRSTYTNCFFCCIFCCTDHSEQTLGSLFPLSSFALLPDRIRNPTASTSLVFLISSFLFSALITSVLVSGLIVSHLDHFSGLLAQLPPPGICLLCSIVSDPLSVSHVRGSLG